MNIGLCIYSRNEDILRLQVALTVMGHKARVFFSDHYHCHCSYWQKKLDGWGFSEKRRQYEDDWRQDFLAYVRRGQSDLILFVNEPAGVMDIDTMREVRRAADEQGTSLAIWFVDPVSDKDYLDDWYPLFDHIYVYEKCDVAFLQEHYSLPATYCPVGFNDAYETIGTPRQGYAYDVAFVGQFSPRRRELLNTVAKAAEEKGWRIKFVGPLYPTRYFYKNWLQRIKYPYFLRHLDSRFITSSETAEIYRQAKIVLNIHNYIHKSLNPRSFEIMATGAFELVDEREDYDLVRPGQDLATFANEDDLLVKIATYLANDDERRRIAANGQKTTRQHYSITASLGQIIYNRKRD